MLLTVGCGGSSTNRPEMAFPAVEPVAVAVADDGTVFVGERGGRLFSVAPSGQREELARFDVATDGQRGLLGVAVSGDGSTVYATVTPSGSRRITVLRQPAGGSIETLWEGPVSADLGNGGHLVLRRSGQLVVGIGGRNEDLALTRDPTSLNGKLLGLDPAGSARQTPEILSGGWNNPYAIAEDPEGSLWVADNAPDGFKERIQAVGEDRPSYLFDGTNVPTGLVVSDDELLVCLYARGVVGRFERYGSRLDASADLAAGCRTDLVEGPDGTHWLADADGVRALRRQ